MADYGIEKTLKGTSFEAAREKVTEALAAEGFGVLTEIDVKATLKKKIDVDFRPYVILGACNPKMAHRALEAEPDIGLLLPCNVVVQETDDGVSVAAVDPKAMFQVVQNPALDQVVPEVEAALRRAIDALE